MLAVVAASCSSSDPGSGAVDTTVDGSSVATDDDLFDEVGTDDEQIDASVAGADPDVGQDTGGSVAPDDDASTPGSGVGETDDTAASGTRADDTEANDIVTSAATPTPADDPVGDDDSADEEEGESGGAVADPDEIDDLNELGDGFAPEVDDTALCRSLAQFLATVQNLAILESLGDSSVGESGDGTVETVELLVYPGLVDDAEILRTDAPEIALEAFGPILERIVASTGFLSDAGLDAGQIDAVASESEFPGLDFDVGTADRNIRNAAAVMTDELGSFGDALAEAESTDVDDDRLDTELDSACPVLGESLGGG